MQTKILLFVDYYLPGFKAGGPLRTISNMTEQLSDQLDFFILTRDRDLGDVAPYTTVKIDQWSEVGKARIYYASSAGRGLSSIRARIREIAPDVIYLNSFFSIDTARCLYLRRRKLIGATPFVLAPRGEFSSGALDLKRHKKILYIRLMKSLGLCRGLLWQASSEWEKQDIQRVMGASAPIEVAPDLPLPDAPEDSLSSAAPGRAKVAGEARLIFLSRISPKKNLLFALELLGQIKGKASLDIYGPLEGAGYWQKCEQLMARLPANVEARYCGTVAPDQARETFSQYDFFLFPTLGENFGHVILESLTAGCPVLLSDRTPWRDLHECEAGWDLPLEREDEWRCVLQECVDMPAQTYDKMSDAATTRAREFTDDSGVVESNLALFERAVNRKEK